MPLPFSSLHVKIRDSTGHCHDGGMINHNGVVWLMQGEIYEDLCDLDDNSKPPNATECELIASLHQANFAILRENNIQLVKFIFPENRQLLLHIDENAANTGMSLIINMLPMNAAPITVPKRKWIRYLPLIALVAISVPLAYWNLFYGRREKISIPNNLCRFGNGKNNPQPILF
jgi:hypothetical protein